MTIVSPGVTEPDLASAITELFAKERMEEFRKNAIPADAIPADAIARAIQYGIEQPSEVDVIEIIVRPIASNMERAGPTVTDKQTCIRRL